MDLYEQYRPLVIRTLGLAAGVTLAALPAVAVECRLALALAIDVSSSVDATEDALQRGGVVAALTAPEVEAAFFSADLPVALAVYEWSGRYNQEIILDWTLIDSRTTLVRAAETVAQSKRSHNDFPTAMGYALGFGAQLLERGPDCLRKTLDMAGDGQSNEGFGPQSAYREFPFEDVTVNGLVVNAADFEGEVGLIAFYRGEVIHGPGAFLIVADGFEDYEGAMQRKLERELTPPAIGALQNQGNAG
ncbi:DUF1194 domain-containing protein [Sulfitobacter sp. S223]|uniref:DUF1194 domain-containing protein n=1 Tax=Sulfitobacter sp. S223 TaxID=2867023 RepID=UPI0021A8C1A4|nr:DUF1194 domain-containing protein [Sulfitobacter sp. S223]UWR25402.1 DUF1194 domain-containing protein [Sulfitobacter sp. S223]